MLIPYLIISEDSRYFLANQYYIINIYFFLFPYSNRDLRNSARNYTDNAVLFIFKNYT